MGVVSEGEQLRRRELLEFHVVDAEPLGPRRLKGFDVTVSVYSLRALKGGAP